MIQQHLIAEAKELCASRRWRNPDTPGSANIKDYGQRIASPGALQAFRETPEGEYLLGVMDAYEEALNDDWLPFAILGLPLQNARIFISSTIQAKLVPSPLKAVSMTNVSVPLAK